MSLQSLAFNQNVVTLQLSSFNIHVCSLPRSIKRYTISSYFSLYHPPRAVTFSWWGIAYLNDPESNAGSSFNTPGRATQARQVEG